jgi:Transglutaminase-like superfamily
MLVETAEERASMPHQVFATQSATTSPRDHAGLFDGLPGDIGGLCGVVQGLVVHAYWANRYGLAPDDARREEVGLRTVARQLARIVELDPRPLTEARPVDRRIVGMCRDFTVLLTAMLRHQGVPARARCGFGRYFEPGLYEDHWACEYWNAGEGRWVLVDAQLDALQREVLGITFDPLDVPRDAFIVAGEAWRRYRAGEVDPDAFGIAELKGLWFVRGDLVRDVAALNRLETLSWDSWGIIEAGDDDLTADDIAFLDRVAALAAADAPDCDALRALYGTDPRLRVPATITSYTQQGPRTVDLSLV